MKTLNRKNPQIRQKGNAFDTALVRLGHHLLPQNQKSLLELVKRD